MEKKSLNFGLPKIDEEEEDTIPSSLPSGLKEKQRKKNPEERRPTRRRIPVFPVTFPRQESKKTNPPPLFLVRAKEERRRREFPLLFSAQYVSKKHKPSPSLPPN